MTIRCETCGMEYENPPGKFCERCGRVLSRFNLEIENNDDPAFRRCNKCGHRNSLEARVCQNCGELLHEPRL